MNTNRTDPPWVAAASVDGATTPGVDDGIVRLESNADRAVPSFSVPLSREERRNQRNAVLSGFLGWTFDAFDFFILSFVIDDVARSFGVSRPSIALTITLTLMMRPVGAIIFGLLADRIGRKTPLMFNVVAFAVLSVLSGIAPNYAFFLVTRALFGIAMGGEWGVGASLALESASPRMRGLLSGLLQEGFAIGNLLAALAFWTVYVPLSESYPEDAWRVLFFLGGLPALLSLFIRAKVKESEAWHEQRTDWATYKQSLRQHWPRFGYLVLLMAFMNFMGHGTQQLYPTFLRQERGFDPGMVATITIIAMIGAVVGGLFFGFKSDTWGRRRAMMTAVAGALFVIPLWILAPSTALIMVGVFLLQFCIQGAWGVVPAHLNELSPSRVRGFFPGLAYQSGNLIAASIVVVQSLLGEHFTYQQSMGVIAAAVVIGAFIVIYVGPEAHGVAFRKRDEQESHS